MAPVGRSRAGSDSAGAPSADPMAFGALTPRSPTPGARLPPTVGTDCGSKRSAEAAVAVGGASTGGWPVSPSTLVTPLRSRTPLGGGPSRANDLSSERPKRAARLRGSCRTAAG